MCYIFYTQNIDYVLHIQIKFTQTQQYSSMELHVPAMVDLIVRFPLWNLGFKTRAFFLTIVFKMVELWPIPKEMPDLPFLF